MEENSAAIELGPLDNPQFRIAACQYDHWVPGAYTTNDSERSIQRLTNNGAGSGRQITELAPTDTGFGAWSFAASAFILETRLGICYGAFQEYFVRQHTFGNVPETTIGSVGTIALGTEYIVAMFVILAAQQWRHKIPVMMWACLAICVLSLCVRALQPKYISHLIFLQGVCFAIGGGGLYAPVSGYLPEWFSVRNGLARSIIFSGAGAGGMICPIAMNYLLEALGFRIRVGVWDSILGLHEASLAFDAFDCDPKPEPVNGD
ncbi:major facilitator superfamily transporter [Ceratobasidium sp. AG-Ba]|nr:major facilitator superfamily transporter [Ceratobasidium sp. AG-Ba]